MIVALLALFVALGGPAEAARLINGGKIKKGTVGSKQLADGGVKARDLAPGAIDRLTATPPDSIGPLQLGINAVTTDALAPNSVLTGNVADGTLTAADLGVNAVGPEEIADNAVGQAQIRPNGVAASEIADGSIDGREVVDGGLSARDIARKVATFSWQVSRLGPDECEARWVPVAGIDLAGSFVLASPITPWPQELVYTVNGTNSSSEFKVQVCYRHTGLATDRAWVPEATYTFRYAVVGP
ncbi:MAG: hypothetical protein ACAH82_16110 [Solirubrobacteraceae bacterium]